MSWVLSCAVDLGYDTICSALGYLRYGFTADEAVLIQKLLLDPQVLGVLCESMCITWQRQMKPCGCVSFGTICAVGRGLAWSLFSGRLERTHGFADSTVKFKTQGLTNVKCSGPPTFSLTLLTLSIL
jgi:hypothetical protein